MGEEEKRQTRGVEEGKRRCQKIKHKPIHKPFRRQVPFQTRPVRIHYLSALTTATTFTCAVTRTTLRFSVCPKARTVPKTRKY